MTGLSGTELAVLLGTGTMLFFGEALRELLHEAISHFRGRGPKPPSHPLPAEDSALLNRRRN